MACVKWFQQHDLRHVLMKPAQLWHGNSFKAFGPASFIPMEKVLKICISISLSVDSEMVIAVNPLRKKYFYKNIITP